MSALNVRAVAVPRLLPVCLSVVAGFINSCTFAVLFRLFVAQVTGSYVIVGAQVVEFDKTMLVPILAIPTFFLVGMSTTLVVAWSGLAGWAALTLALAVELVLVGAFFVVAVVGAPFSYANAPSAVVASFLAISSMGVQSALVRLLTRGVASTNVMTTNTTQLAIDAAEWLIASRRRTVMPDDPAAHAECALIRNRFVGLISIMAGFLGGTAAGALGYRWFGPRCLIIIIIVLASIVTYCAWCAKQR